MVLVLAWSGVAIHYAAEKTQSAPAVAGDLRLDGILQSGGSFVVFVTPRGHESPRQLEALGARAGPWTLVAVDVTNGHADFRRGEEPPLRVWLRDAAIRAGDGVAADGRVGIPPLPTLKGIIGLDEAIAALPRTAEMKARITLDRVVNQEGLAVEERLRRLADLRSGERRHIIVPKGGVDAAFAAKYGLTSAEVARASRVSADADLPQEHPTPRTSYERQ